MKNFNRELLNTDISNNYNICITRIVYTRTKILLDTSTLFYSIEQTSLFRIYHLIYFSYIFLVSIYTLKILFETTDIWHVGLSLTIKNVSLCSNNYNVFG